jgi:hypothetical protein
VSEVIVKVPLATPTMQAVQDSRGWGQTAKTSKGGLSYHWRQAAPPPPPPPQVLVTVTTFFWRGQWRTCATRVCVFITAGPINIIKLCAGGEGDSEGHVL